MRYSKYTSAERDITRQIHKLETMINSNKKRITLFEKEKQNLIEKLGDKYEPLAINKRYEENELAK